MRDVTEAAFWFDRCAERVGADPERMLRDRWVRRTLSEMAVTVLPAGINGYLYRFPDRSRLIVTSEIIQALGR
jgi:hypothetical protein